MEFELNAGGLEPRAVVAIARHFARVHLGEQAIRAMTESARTVSRVVGEGTAAYGISTGVGSLKDVHIAPERQGEFQAALIRSHAAGIGPPIEHEVVRAMMLLRARTLAMGRSGARPAVAETLLAVLNARLTPVVPEYGSVGASGDLAPLAHCALLVIGEGEILSDAGEPLAARPLLQKANIAPVMLTAKEGLALINGTDGMLAMLLLAAHDFERLLRVADICAAMSIAALQGADSVFAADLMALRPHVGQGKSARNLRALLATTVTTGTYPADSGRVQDAYSLRCTPQVAGSARDTLAHVMRIAHIELGAAIDNPVVLPDGRIETCGNFHGAPLAHACDFLAIVAADLGSIVERRTDRLLDVYRSNGLPPFLGRGESVDSGMMIAQYTQAALVAENRRLAVPASVDSVPTSAMQEDHVSMGWGGARKLRSVIQNLTRILAIELACATRGLELREPAEMAACFQGVVDVIRAGPTGCGLLTCPLSVELSAAEAAIASGAILDAVQNAIGPLD